MRIRFELSRQSISGVAVFLVGVVFFIKALEYDIGSPTRMGPGFFPALVSAFVSIVGLVMAILSLCTVREEKENLAFSWRPFVFVTASIASFGAAMLWFGFIPAVMLLVVLSSFGNRTGDTPVGPSVRIINIAILSLVLTASGWLLFVSLLGIQLVSIKLPF